MSMFRMVVFMYPAQQRVIQAAKRFRFGICRPENTTDWMQVKEFSLFL